MEVNFRVKRIVVVSWMFYAQLADEESLYLTKSTESLLTPSLDYMMDEIRQNIYLSNHGELICKWDFLAYLN